MKKIQAQHEEKQKNEKLLEEIRGLLILLAIKNGATATEIGYALNVTQGRVSQIFPVSKIKKDNSDKRSN